MAMQEVKENKLPNRVSQTVALLTGSTFWRTLLKVQEVVLFTTTIVMVGVLGMVVLCRYVLHEDFFGYDEIVLISAFWMYFIGSSYAMEKGEHVRADIVERFLPPRGKKRLRTVAGFVQTGLAIYLAILSIQFLMNATKVWPISSAWEIPLVLPMGAVTVGFVLMAFYVGVQFLVDAFGDGAEEERG